MNFSSYDAFGDSITSGYGVTTPRNCYVSLLGAELGLRPTNHGVAGSQAADQAAYIYGVFSPSGKGGQLITFQIGTNDSWVYSTDVDKQSNFAGFHQACVAYLAIPQHKKLLGQSKSVTYNGKWDDSSLYGGAFSKQSSTFGSTAEFSAWGPTIYLAYTVADNSGGTFSVFADGIHYGNFTAGVGGARIRTHLGAAYGSKLLRITGLSPTQHKIVVEVTSETSDANVVTLDWIASPSDELIANGPTVIVGGVPPNHQFLVSIIYTDVIKANVRTLAEDGLDVVYADTHGHINYPPAPGISSDLIWDDAHLSDIGHMHLRDAYLEALANRSSGIAMAQLSFQGSQILFGNDQLRVEFFPGSGRCRRVAFTFTGATNRKLEGNLYGGAVLARNGFDVIAFKSIADDWFQNLPVDVCATIDSFCTEKGYMQRVAYGASMGGFAAIAFSRALKCDKVLAIAPQFSIRQDFDTRWNSFAGSLTWRYEIEPATIAGNCEFFFIYDDYSLDRHHVERIRRVIGVPSIVHDIRTPFVGHDVSIFLIEVGLLKAIPLAVLDREAGWLSLRRTLNLAKKKSTVYLNTLANKLIERGRVHTAISIMRRGHFIDSNFMQNFHYDRSVVALFIRSLLADERRARDELAAQVRSLRSEAGQAQTLREETERLAQRLARASNLTKFLSRHIVPIASALVIKKEAMRLTALKFDTEFYLREHVDVARAGKDPLIHFISYGRFEGRRFRFNL